MAIVKYNIYNKYLEVFYNCSTWWLLRRPSHVVLLNSWNIELWSTSFVLFHYKRMMRECINFTHGSFCNYIITYTASFHKYFPHFPDMIRSKAKLCINFPRIEKKPYNFRRQTGDIKQFPCWGTIVQNVVAWVTWRLGFVHSCLAAL